MGCFVELEKPRIGRVTDFFLWADYLELQCLLSKDDEVTLSILDEFLNPAKGLHIDSAMVDDLSTGNEDSTIDILSLKYADLASTIRTRAAIFGDSYPFTFQNDIQTLFQKKNFNDLHCLYIFLLLAGNLRFISRDIRHFFTEDFERIGTDALMRLFPAPWEWRHLGTARHPSVPSYQGRKIDKLKAIGSDINALFIAPEDDFCKTDSSDAGFDFLCWYPFGNDTASHLPLIFAQSGCSAEKDEIYNKQRSVSSERVRNFFSQICSYSIIVTPGCFRNASGVWPNVSEVTSVLIDRPRIIKLLTGNGYSICDIPSMQHINQALAG